MTESACSLHEGKSIAYLMISISISIRMATDSQPPATEISNKRSEIPELTSREERREETAKRRKTKRPKKRTLGAPRRARRNQRRRRRRVRFMIPKKPLPPFFLFMAQHRPQLQKSNPHQPAVETAKRLGKKWHSQTEKEKEMYKEQAVWLRKQKQKKSKGRGKSRKSQKKRLQHKKIQAKRRKRRL